MTQAFNLSQLANNLNTSGQLDATDGLTGVVPLANGGTGTTNTVNTVVAGTGISISTSGTQVTVSTSGGGGVTSLNGQTGAITNTDFQAIGSYAVLMNNQDATLAINGTRAGSSLWYNTNYTDSPSNNSLTNNNYSRFPGVNYNVGKTGTAVSGTWRKLDDGSVYVNNTCIGYRYYGLSLYVRIS
jgi:hypothetical protein